MQKNQHWELIKPPEIGFRYNKSLKYLLPLCNLPSEGLKSLPLNVNAKSAFDVLVKLGFKTIVWEVDSLDENFPHCLFLVFNPKKDVLFEKFQIFHEFYSKLNNFKQVVDLDFGVIVVIFTMGAKEQEVIRHVRNGQYSKIDINMANKLYLRIKDGTSYYSDELQVIKKTEGYRKKLEESLGLAEGTLEDVELDSKPLKSEEEFIYEVKHRI